MKVIKNCLFYLFLGSAFIMTILGLCIYDGSILGILCFWGVTVALWVITIFGFTTQLIDFLRRKKALTADDEDFEEEDDGQLRLPEIIVTGREHTQYEQDFEECWHIALICRVNNLIKECNKRAEVMSR